MMCNNLNVTIGEGELVTAEVEEDLNDGYTCDMCGNGSGI